MPYFVRPGSVNASFRLWLCKMDRWPLMLATLTTRPALLLRVGVFGGTVQVRQQGVIRASMLELL